MRERLAKYLLVVGALSIAIGILDRLFPPDLTRYREASLEVLARDGEPLRVFTTRDGMLRLATCPTMWIPVTSTSCFRSRIGTFGGTQGLILWRSRAQSGSWLATSTSCPAARR
jgi:hypothetical protein